MRLRATGLLSSAASLPARGVVAGAPTERCSTQAFTRCLKAGRGFPRRFSSGFHIPASPVAASFSGRGEATIPPMELAGRPVPVWDDTGGPAVLQRPESLSDSHPPKLALEPGKLHKVIWMCWTGHNPMPPHLRLCMKTVQRNANVPVILVTPQNITQYVPDPHPAYPFLHLQHRADYLRCCLLHLYGGIYLDVDTVCLKSLVELFDLLETHDAVGYDGAEWGEFIGISDMGPFRPGSGLTELWFDALHGKLEQRMEDILEQRTDVFYWQEILRDIFVPVSLMHKDKISTALLAHNPEMEILWSTEPFQNILGEELRKSHVFILNNAKYGQALRDLSEKDILKSPAVLSQVLRHALGLVFPVGPTAASEVTAT